MIGPNKIATAAHCLYPGRHGGHTSIIMKKKKIIFLSIIMLLVFGSGCILIIKKNMDRYIEPPNNCYMMRGIIRNITAYGITFDRVDGKGDLLDRGLIMEMSNVIIDKNNKVISKDKLEIGTYILIYYSGRIEEVYPESISEVYMIKIEE